MSINSLYNRIHNLYIGRNKQYEDADIDETKNRGLFCLIHFQF